MDPERRILVEEMAECLSRLEPEEKSNLRWHYIQGTPKCCGKKAKVWTDGEGAG